MTPKSKLYGWYSPKQHGAAGGYAEYLNSSGETIQVTEVLEVFSGPAPKPTSRWDDFEYRGLLKSFVRNLRSGEV